MFEFYETNEIKNATSQNLTFRTMSFGNKIFMKVLKISKVFDFLFGAFFLFLISFVWIRYFLHDFWLTIVLSAFATFLIMAIYHLLQSQKENKKLLSAKEIQNAHAISTKFLLQTKHEVLHEFQKKLNKKYDVQCKSDYLLINKNILRPVFSCSTITDTDVIESYTKTKSLHAEKLIIVCQNASESAKKIAEFVADKKVVILEEMEAYNDIYKPLDFAIPEQKSTKKKKQMNDYLSFALCKARTKNYLLVSVFMLAASFVLRYNIYYIIFASITTLLALYSHFNKRFNLPKQRKFE